MKRLFNEVAKWQTNDVWGWEGLIYLEEPVKSGGAYPYGVKARVYKFTDKWQLIKVTEELDCGIYGEI